MPIQEITEVLRRSQDKIHKTLLLFLEMFEKTSLKGRGEGADLSNFGNKWNL